MTVFEVLIAVIIFSIIALGLASAVVVGKDALFVSDIPTQLRGNVLFALMPMIQELRQTAPAQTNLGAGASGNAITFRIPFDNNADGMVVDNNGSIEWGGAITYACNASNQLTRTFGGATAVIAPNITSLLFNRPAGEDALLQISVVAQKADNQGNLYQDNEQAIIKMRN